MRMSTLLLIISNMLFLQTQPKRKWVEENCLGFSWWKDPHFDRTTGIHSSGCVCDAAWWDSFWSESRGRSSYQKHCCPWIQQCGVERSDWSLSWWIQHRFGCCFLSCGWKDRQIIMSYKQSWQCLNNSLKVMWKSLSILLTFIEQNSIYFFCLQGNLQHRLVSRVGLEKK